MRKLASIAVTAGLVVTLSACSGTPFDIFGGCKAVYQAGSNSDLVSADGRFGKDPKADFPTPLVAVDDQAQVIDSGDGTKIDPGATVDTQITVYDAATGDRLISTDYDQAGLRVAAIAGQPAFGAVATCATVGSRIAAVGTAGELIGATAIAQNGIRVTEDQTVVLVVDVLRSFLGKANGADQWPQAGFPAIVLAPDGRPGFTFPSSTAPTDLKIAALKAGNGATVAEGDRVVLNYTGVVWGAKKPFDSTWEKGVPATLVAAENAGVIPGFAKAIIGQKVGSQVIVVIPPEFGYPAGSAPASIGEGATIVFVIDILGIE